VHEITVVLQCMPRYALLRKLDDVMQNRIVLFKNMTQMKISTKSKEPHQPKELFFESDQKIANNQV
jgi:hypothetical protein